MRVRVNHRLHCVGIDFGCAQLIVDGKVAVKSGCELGRFNPDGVVFTDGSELAVDAIVYA